MISDYNEMHYKVCKWTKYYEYYVFNVALGNFFFWAILAPMTNFSDIKSDMTYYRG